YDGKFSGILSVCERFVVSTPGFSPRRRDQIGQNPTKCFRFAELCFKEDQHVKTIRHEREAYHVSIHLDLREDQLAFNVGGRSALGLVDLRYPEVLSVLCRQWTIGGVVVEWRTTSATVEIAVYRD